MDFGEALTFPLRDKDWFTKILIQSALLAIPVLGAFLLAGWALAVCRGAVRGKTSALPALSFRRHLADGAAAMGILAVGALPFLLAVAAGGISGAAWEAAHEDAAGAIELYWWGVECLGLILALAGAVWATAAIGFLADTGSFRSALDIRRVFPAIRSAPAAFLLAVLAWIPLGLLAASGTAVCCLGAFFTIAYASASANHLAGQAYALAAAKRTGPTDA